MPAVNAAPARRRDAVDTRLEYLLYVLAKRHPQILDEAEQFSGSMLTADSVAGDRARTLAERFAAQMRV
jgi:hypothetical protein